MIRLADFLVWIFIGVMFVIGILAFIGGFLRGWKKEDGHPCDDPADLLGIGD